MSDIVERLRTHATSETADSGDTADFLLEAADTIDSLRLAATQAQSEREALRKALAVVRSKAGNNTTRPQDAHAADPGFAGIWFVANAALTQG